MPRHQRTYKSVLRPTCNNSANELVARSGVEIDADATFENGNAIKVIIGTKERVAPYTMVKLDGFWGKGKGKGKGNEGGKGSGSAADGMIGGETED